MIARRFILSEQAADDLTDIYVYIVALDERAARKVVDGIKGKIRGVAAFGLTGSPQADFEDGLRMVVFRHYRIYFRVTPTHLYVLRILHGRRMIEASTFTESDTD